MKILVSVMLVLALFSFVFNVDVQFDFMKTLDYVLQPMHRLGDSVYDSLAWLMDIDINYNSNSVVSVRRYYYDDGASYVDFILYNDIADTFNESYQFEFCSDPEVSSCKLNIFERFVFRDSSDDVLYKIYIRSIPNEDRYSLKNIKYGEYCAKYRYENSSYGWDCSAD